jgi:hypothetical protein
MGGPPRALSQRSSFFSLSFYYFFGGVAAAAVAGARRVAAHRLRPAHDPSDALSRAVGAVDRLREQARRRRELTRRHHLRGGGGSISLTPFSFKDSKWPCRMPVLSFCGHHRLGPAALPGALLVEAGLRWGGREP